jgi:hypothetical protein
MKHAQDPLVRLAMAIHAQLVARRRAVRLDELPADRWSRCETLVRDVRRAELRGWHLAAGEVRRDLQYAVRSLQLELLALADRLEATPPGAPTPTLRDVYEDLVALEEEFEGLDYDRSARSLVITTESIELDGVPLGPFEIRLDWGRPTAETCYRIVALEPNPAAARQEVTHPHVLDEVLCEGHGRQAIRQALAEGRLLDFFTLVAGVLRTYNAESPFVALDAWYGRVCSDCGSFVSEDERFTCSECGDDLCDECYVPCAGCEEPYCRRCLTPCEVCDDSYCQSCLGRCAECGAAVCHPCLNDEERCPNCHEDEDESKDQPLQPHAAADAHGLGQALVSA